MSFSIGKCGSPPLAKIICVIYHKWLGLQGKRIRAYTRTVAGIVISRQSNIEQMTVEPTAFTLFMAVLLGVAIVLAGMALFGYYPMKRQPLGRCMNCTCSRCIEEYGTKPRRRSASISQIDDKDTNLQIEWLREDLNRVLNALASHEHVDGRATTVTQSETGPTEAAGS